MAVPDPRLLYTSTYTHLVVLIIGRLGICGLSKGHHHQMEWNIMMEDLSSSSKEYCNKDQQSRARVPESSPQWSLIHFQLPLPVLFLELSKQVYLETSRTLKSWSLALLI